MQRFVSTGLAAAAILLASVRALSSGAHAMAAGDAVAVHVEATIPNAAKPIDKVACWGWGWHCPGVYAGPLGLRPACWGGPYYYGGPVYVAPGYVAPAPVVYPPAVSTTWYCDNPRGYYPGVAACATGWRMAPGAQ